jgi:uncharacterized protein YjbI with pentapeptide repeats
VETKGLDGTRAVITKADLKSINLEYADLRASIFEGTDFSEGNLLTVTFRGSNLRNTSFARAYLNWAVLRFCDLTAADFTEADLRNSDLRETTLEQAVFSGANLTEVDFHSANLAKADMRNANLELAALGGTNLRHAILDGANLMLANLKDADFESASLISVSNVDVGKICEAKTLYNARLDEDVLEAVKKHCPRLLEKPGAKVIPIGH